MAQTNDAFDELQVQIRVVYTSLLGFSKEAATAVKAQLKHATPDWQSRVPKLADAQAIAGEALEKANKEVLESTGPISCLFAGWPKRSWALAPS